MENNFTVALLTDGISPYTIGGMQKISFNLIRNFLLCGVHVDLYHFEEIDKSKFETELMVFTPVNINYYRVNIPKFPFYFPGHYIVSSFIYSKRIYQILKRNSADAIYSQGFTSWFFLRSALRPKIFTNLHGFEMFQKAANYKVLLGHILLRIPARYILKNSLHQLSYGGKITDILLGLSVTPAAIIEVPNAIDNNWISSNFNIEYSNHLIFTFIGRFERRKGLFELTKVVSELLDKFDFTFNFIGYVPEEFKIIDDRIIYHGIIYDEYEIKSILHSTNVLVSPSYSEGMPTVILEAMACGCAILATDVGAVNCMVDCENGWLIDGDLEADLRCKFVEIFKTPREVLIDKQYKSIKKVRNFLWEVVVLDLLKKMKNRIEI